MPNNDNDAHERSKKREKERERRRDLSNAFEELTHLLFQLDPEAGRFSKKSSYSEVAKRGTKAIRILKQSNAELRHRLDERKAESSTVGKECVLVVPNVYGGNPNGNIFCQDGNHHHGMYACVGQSYPPPPVYYNAFHAGFQHPEPHMVSPLSSSSAATGISYLEGPFPPSLSRETFGASETAADEARSAEYAASSGDCPTMGRPERVTPRRLDSFSTDNDDDCDSLVFDGMNESV